MPTKPAVKIIALLRRKPGLSIEDFIDYYETRHAPLVLSLVPFISDYRRNYVRSGSAIATMDGGQPDCDVITEAWFETKRDFERFCEEGEKPENRALIIADELNFLDRDSLRMFIVEEHASVIAPITAAV